MMTVMEMENCGRSGFGNDLNGNLMNSPYSDPVIDFTQLLHSPEESVYNNSIFPDENRRKDNEFDDDRHVLPLDMRISFDSTDSLHVNDTEQENYG